MDALPFDERGTSIGCSMPVCATQRQALLVIVSGDPRTSAPRRVNWLVARQWIADIIHRLHALRCAPCHMVPNARHRAYGVADHGRDDFGRYSPRHQLRLGTDCNAGTCRPCLTASGSASPQLYKGPDSRPTGVGLHVHRHHRRRRRIPRRGAMETRRRAAAARAQATATTDGTVRPRYDSTISGSTQCSPLPRHSPQSGKQSSALCMERGRCAWSLSLRRAIAGVRDRQQSRRHVFVRTLRASISFSMLGDRDALWPGIT